MSDGPPVLDASAEALVGEVVDDFLERLGRGERPEVEKYAQRYPQLASVFKHMLPALQSIHLSAPDQQLTKCLDAEIEPEAPLGDFRLVREIGRGGMGALSTKQSRFRSADAWR